MSEKPAIGNATSIEHLRRAFQETDLLDGFDRVIALRNFLNKENSEGTEIYKEFDQLKCLVKAVMDGDLAKEQQMFELADMLSCRVLLIKKMA